MRDCVYSPTKMLDMLWRLREPHCNVSGPVRESVPGASPPGRPPASDELLIVPPAEIVTAPVTVPCPRRRPAIGPGTLASVAPRATCQVTVPLEGVIVARGPSSRVPALTAISGFGPSATGPLRMTAPPAPLDRCVPLS